MISKIDVNRKNSVLVFFYNACNVKLKKHTFVNFNICGIIAVKKPNIQ